MLSLKIHNQHFPTRSLVDQHILKRVVLKVIICLNYVHKNTARNFFMDVWLVFGSMLKLPHVENVSL